MAADERGWEVKHTPAPWEVSLGHGGELWFDLKESGEWTESDRQLAEAAPDMFDALCGALGALAMVESQFAHWNAHPHIVRNVEAAMKDASIAISKAKRGAE